MEIKMKPGKVHICAVFHCSKCGRDNITPVPCAVTFDAEFLAAMKEEMDVPEFTEIDEDFLAKMYLLPDIVKCHNCGSNYGVIPAKPKSGPEFDTGCSYKD